MHTRVYKFISPEKSNSFTKVFPKKLILLNFFPLFLKMVDNFAISTSHYKADS